MGFWQSRGHGDAQGAHPGVQGGGAPMGAGGGCRVCQLWGAGSGAGCASPRGCSSQGGFGGSPDPCPSLPPLQDKNRKLRPLYDIPYMFEAREFLRKKLIGKKVRRGRGRGGEVPTRPRCGRALTRGPYGQPRGLSVGNQCPQSWRHPSRWPRLRSPLFPGNALPRPLFLRRIFRGWFRAIPGNEGCDARVNCRGTCSGCDFQMLIKTVE